jgi:hypothetical protein
VGGLKVQGGHGVSLRRRQAGGRVDYTIAIALVVHCGHHGWGGVGHGGRREIREGEVILVLIPLLIAPIFR